MILLTEIGCEESSTDDPEATDAVAEAHEGQGRHDPDEQPAEHRRKESLGRHRRKKLEVRSQKLEVVF
jgi:hypothetical protein